MMLDTCFCVDLMREQKRGIEGPACRKLAALGNGGVCIPVFVLCELLAGAKLAQNPSRELRKVEMFKECNR